MATAYTDQVQKVYIAYYGRAADPVGLAYWAAKVETDGLAGIMASFGASAEATALYGSLTSNTAKVNALYQQSFGRDADLAGLLYYAGELTKGTMTAVSIAQNIFDGAAGDDATILANKLIVAKAYTAAIDTAAEVVAYSGTVAAASARALLTTVDAATVTASFDVATSVASVVTTSNAVAVVEGNSYTLTTATDIINGTTTTAANKTTSGDDTIYGTTTDTFGGDLIDGGAGTDAITATLTSNDQTVTPTSVKNVESIELTAVAANTKTLTFDATNITGMGTLTLKGAGAVSRTSNDELITINNLDKTATFNILGGTAATGTTASEITVNFASALAADTQKIGISTLGKTAVLTLATATTVDITATGTGTTGANTIASLVSAATTLNLKGSGDLTISAVDLGATPTIDATTATGKISFAGESGVATIYKGNNAATTVTMAGTAADNITTGSGADTITTGGAGDEVVTAGAGDDKVIIGATTAITAADSISGGLGTDTLSTSDGTLNATDKTALALGVDGFENIESTAATIVTVDYNALSAYDTVEVGAAMATAFAGANTAGGNSVTVTMENEDSLLVSASRAAQAGGASGIDATIGDGEIGGDALSLAVRLDNGSNVLNLSIEGNSDFIGGVGEEGQASNASGGGGDALDAVNVETLNLTISGTQTQNAAGSVTGDVVTFGAAAAGAKHANGTAGAAGKSVIVGTNATIVLTSTLTGSTADVHNDVDLGTIVGSNVTVNGSAFLGNITATANSGNVTLTGGAGADTFVGGAGTDTISGGAGNDSITGLAGADVITVGTGRDAVIMTAVTESAAAANDTITGFGKATIAATAAEVAAMNSIAAFKATATAKGGAEADVLDLFSTVALEAAESGINVAAGVTGSGTVTGTLSATGILTVQGSDAADVDTIGEWVDVLEIMLNTDNDVGAFEFGGDTYVLQNTGIDANDQLLQLVGVTGVTGLVKIGTSVAATVDDIFII